MTQKLGFLLAALIFSSQAWGAPLQVKEFQSLPEAQQRHIIDASYNAVSVALAFTQAEENSPTPAARQLASCLRDREPSWVGDALAGYLKAAGFTPTSLGAAVTQAMMWKCGVLTIGGH
jgi:hypothetical protein